MPRSPYKFDLQFWQAMLNASMERDQRAQAGPSANLQTAPMERSSAAAASRRLWIDLNSSPK